ncbi:conserved hypothetical protein [Methanohalobium evestigatum Z-7303]|uniref:DUF2150 family protein n=1 Tax=Methanohalobium evestigatum (strain ATCC BAA-1072 / DSM 3721 / NBRC 107634 / OCM 161 / Z-7303) TaxID=644295 RepID=D7E8C9_METEZ|nr:DUF2150 family protein [Methanohalobium evestigatum]ADI73471.1 conserved hypothetical protein [Methanohalobium evestigatum Z-7303]
MPNSSAQKEHVNNEFYTQKRWNNWINKVKESGFEFKESDEETEKESAIFVYMQDDVILACLKVIAQYERNILSKEDTLDIISQIREIVLEEIDSISEDIDLMIESLQTSLMAAIAACEVYIMDEYDKEAKIDELIKAAVDAEDSEDLQVAMQFIAETGARVIGGEQLPENIFDELPYGLVAEWLDGIDSIAAAMVGADSYKEDDGSGDFEPI